MTLDRFLDKTYHKERYNCLHFVAEVWEALTGQNIAARLGAILTGSVVERKAKTPYSMGFEALERPLDPCLVLMRRARETPHVGIYTDCRVLHIRQSGVELMPLEIAAFGFSKVSYYK